jgi:cytochrome c553
LVLPTGPAPRLGEPLNAYDQAFLDLYGKMLEKRPTWNSVSNFPSATYDNVWVKKGKGQKADFESQYITSDQCTGCHDAGGTGLQFDMTKPLPSQAHGYQLENFSPYATWRSSPMGLAGRDPIFFAQLASETQTFHPESKEFVETTCLGCHGISGQRQFQLDNKLAGNECGAFTREMVKAIPYPPGNLSVEHANYGALARDGISCAACHHAVFDQASVDKVKDQPQNACVIERQQQLNCASGLKGFAATFTGSFFVGERSEFYGPFKDVKTMPMQHALGITPVHKDQFASSELCGSCHTVHLPVLHKGKTIKYHYEQTTYPEWLFSAYRTGTSPMGPLPLGAGDRSASCQACHMKNTDPSGKLTVSKIASIQEYSNFPQAEHVLPPSNIDLPEREGFARHTLAGLNEFLIKMAEQFPDIFGIPTLDPMLGKKGLPPLLRTEQKMLDQAANEVADIKVTNVKKAEATLVAEVSINNKVGHKLPSSVGFRRAFVEFEVLDRIGRTIWSSGSTNGAGVIVDNDGKPINGELWWNDDCSARLSPGNPKFQPHFQKITSSSQAQIYQELTLAPADVPDRAMRSGSSARR